MNHQFFSLIIDRLSLFKAIANIFLPLITIYPLNPAFSIPASQTCPDNLDHLTSLLIQDLPDYSNRIIQRTQNHHHDASIDTYIIIAGQPENEPLSLPQINYDSTRVDTSEQIFFSVLERQYTNHKKMERESYHWLFLAPTEDGWYMVTMFSRFGTSSKDNPPTPPQESSQGIIGQAVNLWLRDCRANLDR